VNPCQATLSVELSSTLIPKSTKTYSYASSRESSRERRFATSDPFPIKPLRKFVLFKQEVRKRVNRGIALSNIIKRKHNYKVTFTFKHLFLNLIIKLSLKFYISFLTGTTYKELKLRIHNLLALLKKSRELETYLYGARFKEE
jgi:hypothetical protein